MSIIENLLHPTIFPSFKLRREATEIKPQVVELTTEIPTATDEISGSLDSLVCGPDVYFVRGKQKLNARGRRLAEGMFSQLSERYSPEQVLNASSEYRDKINAQEGDIEQGILSALFYETPTLRDLSKKKLKVMVRERLADNPAFAQIALEKRLLSSISQRARMKMQEEEFALAQSELDDSDLLNFRQRLIDEGKSGPGNLKALRQAHKWFSRADRIRQLEQMQKLGISDRQVRRYREKINKERFDPISIVTARKQLIEERQAKRTKADVNMVARMIATTVAATGITGVAVQSSGEAIPTEKQAVTTTIASHSGYSETKGTFQEILSDEKCDLTAIISEHSNIPESLVFEVDGRVIGEYFQALSKVETNIPFQYLDWIDAVEGPVNQSGKDFLAKLGIRNALALVDENRPFSGASDPAMQLAELIGGGFNQTLIVDEAFPFNHPEKYSLDYLQSLIKAVYGGNNVSEELAIQLSESTPTTPTPDSLTGNLSEDTIAQLCAKLECYLTSRELLAKFGEEEVLKAYFNLVPLSTTAEGLQIYGVPAASEYYFGKSINDLGDAEKVILIGLIQNPNHYSSDRQIMLDRAKTIVRILYNKELIDESKKNSIIQEFDQVGFSSSQEWDNTWILDQPEFLLAQIYANIDLDRQGRTVPQAWPISTFQTAVSLEPIPFPEAQKLEQRQMSLELKPVFIENPSMQGFIDQRVREALEKREDGSYVLKIDKETEIALPPFEEEAGLAFTVIDATDPNNPELLATYDGTNILSQTPIVPGSTIKPFITQWLIEQTGINPDTELIANSPGDYALVHPSLDVRNSNYLLRQVREDNELTLSKSLAVSTNVVFQKLVKEFLDNNPYDGWQRLTDHLSELGLTLTDINGNILLSPTDYAAIGSDVYVGNLETFARAFGNLVNPTGQGENKTMASEKVWQILRNQDLKTERFFGGGYCWDEEALGYFNPEGESGTYGFKTGTVTTYGKGGTYTSNLNTIGAIKTKDGRTVVIAVRVAGQKDGQSINLDSFSSSHTPLPIARWALGLAAEYEPVSLNLTSPEDAIVRTNRFWDKPDVYRYEISQLRSNSVVKDRFGNPLFNLREGQILDVLGKPQGQQRLVPVSIQIGNGQVTTGFIPVENLSSKLIDESESIATLNLLAENVQANGGLKKIAPNFVLVDTENRSPILCQIAADLQNRNQLMVGPEDYQDLAISLGMAPNRTIFVNQELLRTYLGEDFDSENLSVTQETLAEVISQQLEFIRLNTIINESITGTNFQEIFWQNGITETPSNVLLSLLSKRRVSTSMIFDDEKLVLEHLQADSNSRLATIAGQYWNLVGKLEKGQKIMGRDARGLVELLLQLNDFPSEQELLILGIE